MPLRGESHLLWIILSTSFCFRSCFAGKASRITERLQLQTQPQACALPVVWVGWELPWLGHTSLCLPHISYPKEVQSLPLGASFPPELSRSPGDLDSSRAVQPPHPKVKTSPVLLKPGRLCGPFLLTGVLLLSSLSLCAASFPVSCGPEHLWVRVSPDT